MDNLKALRVKLNLTQQQFAKAIGVGRQAYAKWETGEREPDKATLIKMADYHNVTVDYLLGRPGASVTFTAHDDTEPLEKIRSGMEKLLERPISRKQAQSLLLVYKNIVESL